MKYKLVAADFDGTLYDSDTPSISKENNRAIREYIELGGRFVIATGRMYSSIRPFALELGLKGEIIAYQGASVYDIETSELLLDIPLECEEAYIILRYIEDNGYHCQIYYNDIYYVSEENEYTESYSRYCGVNLTNTNMPLSDYIKINNIRPTKIMVIMDKDKLFEFHRKTIELFGGKYGFARSSDIFLEITSKLANKGVALEYLASKYNIKREEIIAIGDSTNDIAMIRYAGLGIAVANAMEELKVEADMIGDYAADNAVAKILYKIIREQL